MDLHLITSSPELGEDIGGEEPRVAVGDVDIEVMYSTQAIEKAFKPSHQLNLVKKEVVHRRIDHPLFDIQTKELGIQYILVLLIVKGNADDMVVCNTGRDQMIVVELEEQIRLSSSTQPGEDSHQAILPAVDEALSIDGARNLFYRMLLRIFVGYYNNS